MTCFLPCKSPPLQTICMGGLLKSSLLQLYFLLTSTSISDNVDSWTQVVATFQLIQTGNLVDQMATKIVHMKLSGIFWL